MIVRAPLGTVLSSGTARSVGQVRHVDAASRHFQLQQSFGKTEFAVVRMGSGGKDAFTHAPRMAPSGGCVSYGLELF